MGDVREVQQLVGQRQQLRDVGEECRREELQLLQGQRGGRWLDHWTACRMAGEGRDMSEVNVRNSDTE